MPDGEEKSFPATQRRREEARKKGNVARSPDVSATATLLAMILVLHVALPGSGGQSLIAETRTAFTFSSRDLGFNIGAAHLWQLEGLYWVGRLVIPVLVLALVLGLAVTVAQVGFHVTPEALAPKWDRINPATGF